MSSDKTTSSADNIQPAVLNQVQAAKFVSLSYRTLIRLRKQGRFAPEIQLTDGRIGWLVSDLLAWVESKKKQPTSE